MKNLLANDKHPMSRRRILRHAFASGSLLVTGILVVGFAQMGGAPVTSTTYPSYGCSTPTRTATTAVAYHGLYTTSAPRTVTKTIYKTKTVTRTIYRTRTKTVCRTTTVTDTGTTTETVTETVTEKVPTTVTVTESSTN